MTDPDAATVLLVEDNAQVRRLLGAVLRAIGIRRVVSAANGSEAIRILRQQTPTGSEGTDDGESGTHFDVVISDWKMHPGDGVALLRWIRRHRESPNRFVPFLMLSAYVDPDRVRLARDLGASAYIAKPFTADTVARYVSIALADARRFVEIGDYFGPDRRGNAPDLSEAERRDRDRSDREKGVRFFMPPQSMEGRRTGGTPIDAQRLMTIQKVIEQRAESFLDWTKESVARLDLELDMAVKRRPGERRVPFNRINQIAHELRGQGTTFGYPLISAIAKNIEEATARDFDRSDATLAIIRMQAKGLKQVVRSRLTGDGGTEGQELMRTLAPARTDENTAGDGGRGGGGPENDGDSASSTAASK
ncbi:response regulator [Marivibrio halodurans]|uniref:Response regulator n=1 Tax=Marivibrio halodurans TaxID=2039722 RepID=A0A8J7SGX8_9PROT|nr:response regulator [Marivibrio halodurans]MBP5856013.1 response regulator [Marivibrio halodurans]